MAIMSARRAAFGKKGNVFLRWLPRTTHRSLAGVVPAGRISNKLLTTMDILPNVAKLCGAKLPKQPIDGMDWIALLNGNDTVTPHTHFYYYYRKNSLKAVRQGEWKLVFK